jgi:integrase
LSRGVLLHLAVEQALDVPAAHASRDARRATAALNPQRSQLITLDVPALAAHQRRMLDRGATASTVRSVLTVVSGILQIAVEYGHLPGNPARAMRKVPADPTEEARPLAPAVLERLLLGLEGRDRAIVLLGGHLGLRPQEIRPAPWSSLEDGHLIVGRTRTKATARRTRTVAVPATTFANSRRGACSPVARTRTSRSSAPCRPTR